MKGLRVFVSRLVGGVMRSRRDEELRLEIDAHVDEAADDLRRSGMPAYEARREALRRFGGVTSAHEAWRDVRAFAAVDDLRRDLRQSMRALARRPGFSYVVLLVLGVGIAAVTSVFTLLNAIVLRPLPFADADRLVLVRTSAPGLGLPDAGLSSGLYFHFAEHATSLEAMALYQDRALLNLRRSDGGTRAVIAGAAMGVVLSLAAARGLRVWLFDVQSHDPLVLLVVSLALLATAGLAALLAARQATRIAPVSALRAD